MKILFNGCSITWGDELEDNRKSRFSKLVCDELDTDEKNLSMRGASNDYIVRTTIDYCDKNTVDIAVIQFTVESRIEYFDCLLYTSPSPRDSGKSRIPSSA